MSKRHRSRLLPALVSLTSLTMVLAGCTGSPAPDSTPARTAVPRAATAVPVGASPGPAAAVAGAAATRAAASPAAAGAAATRAAASPAAAGAAGTTPLPTARPALTGTVAPTTGGTPTQSAASPAPVASVTVPAAASAAPARAAVPANVTLTEYPVPPGSHPHDVAPAPDGTVWYTAQSIGELGRLDPASGKIDSVKLGAGSAPHGVIVGPDGAAWVTDSGLNAIVRVAPQTLAVRSFPLPGSARANLNTATFDRRGILWFTGQNGYYGRVDPNSGEVEVFEAPRGRGPYGIHTTPDGAVFYASLAGNHIARIDITAGTATVLEPPTSGQGARRVWADSRGRIWVSEWNVGKVGMYDPASNQWQEWRLPGQSPLAYSVYVDENDHVWLSDFGANALVRFVPETGEFRSFPIPSGNAQVRQLLGRRGEVWGAESGADKLIVARY